MLNVRRAVPALLAAALVTAARLMTLPRGAMTAGEIRFAQAVVSFDPLHRHPEAPGYPLYVALARVAAFFCPTPFAALVLLGVVASAAGAWFFARAAGEIADDDTLGAAAAVVLFGSPALLIFGPLPGAHAPAIAFVALALFALVRRHPVGLALACAAAIGCLPQSAPAVIVLFAFGLARVERRTLAVALFAIATAFSFLPLVEAIGRSGLAEYASTSFAAVRRASEASGLRGPQLALRFLAHPWGAKWMSVLVLLAAVAGIAVAWRRRRGLVLPVVAFSIVQLALAFAAADRSAGVEPVLPALVAPALLAALAFVRVPRIGLAVAVAYGVASLIYAGPLLRLRRTQVAPAERATIEAAAALPPNGVLLYESPYEPFAQRFAPATRQADLARIDELAGNPAVPLVLLGDGPSAVPGANTFAWPDSDVYGKLTTERFRVVSVIPLELARRYVAVTGVHPPERAFDGREWRWLAQNATVRLLPLDCSGLRVTMALPLFAPYDQDSVAVDAGGGVVEALVSKQSPVSLTVPSKQGQVEVAFHAARSFVPDEVSGNGDRRQLAVQLVSIEQQCGR